MVFLLIFGILFEIKNEKHKIERVFLFFILPLQNAENYFYKNFNNLKQSFKNIESLKKENYELKKEINRLREKENKVYEYYLENKRLRKILLFKEKNKFKNISSSVIGRSPTKWLSFLIINRGEKDGIKTGNAVINTEGMVGKIERVGLFSSRVLLFLDENCKIGAMDQRSREMGIVKGNKDFYKFEYLSSDADIKLKDKIISSGLSENIPKGIYIGRVEKVIKLKGRPIYVEIKPAVNFSTLEEVMVVCN